MAKRNPMNWDGQDVIPPVSDEQDPGFGASIDSGLMDGEFPNGSPPAGVGNGRASGATAMNAPSSNWRRYAEGELREGGRLRFNTVGDNDPVLSSKGLGKRR